MTLTVRRGHADDSAVIALLGRLTFRETFGALFAGHEDGLAEYLDKTFSVAKISASIAKPENHYRIADVDGLPVGYAKLKFPSANALIDDPESAQLQKIYVLSEFLGLRIGHALIHAAIRDAALTRAKRVWLTVLDTNDTAIRFYERHGWTEAGTSTFRIGEQRFSFLVMATRICSAAAN